MTAKPPSSLLSDTNAKQGGDIGRMIYGYARVSTDGQTTAAQSALQAEKVFQEVASGAQTDRAQLRNR